VHADAIEIDGEDWIKDVKWKLSPLTNSYELFGLDEEVITMTGTFKVDEDDFWMKADNCFDSNKNNIYRQDQEVHEQMAKRNAAMMLVSVPENDVEEHGCSKFDIAWTNLRTLEGNFFPEIDSPQNLYVARRNEERGQSIRICHIMFRVSPHSTLPVRRADTEVYAVVL
jgi:hypothetical protein